jgi:hypothetical protein
VDHHDREGKGRMLLSALPARLCELVPAARGALAQAAVDAFCAVPWIADMTRPAGADPIAAEYSASDALVGGEIIGDFLPYGLIYRSLDNLLRRSAYDAAGSRSLLEHCGNFMATIMTHDMELKEPLALYLKEDIDKNVADALARFTVLGQSSEFLRESGADPAGAGFIAAAHGNSIPRPPQLLRFSSLWDAPRCFLEMVPEVADNFSDIVIKAVGQSARGAHQANGSFDLVHAIVGRPVRELVRPERLVREAVARVIDGMFRKGGVSVETIRGCCRFMALAAEADKEFGGHLLRVLSDTLSVEFSRIALNIYHDDGEFRDVLLRVAAQS